MCHKFRNFAENAEAFVSLVNRLKQRETTITYERKEEQQEADQEQADRDVAEPVHAESRQAAQLQADIQGAAADHPPGKDARRGRDGGHGVGRFPEQDERKLVQAEPEGAGAGGQVHTQAQRKEQLCARRRRQTGIRGGAQLEVGAHRRPSARHLHGAPPEAHQGGNGHRHTGTRTRPVRRPAAPRARLRLPRARRQRLRQQHHHTQKPSEGRQDRRESRGEGDQMARRRQQEHHRRGG